MPTYSFYCKYCDLREDHIVALNDINKIIRCRLCGETTKREFPVEAALGYQPFETYHDEALGVDIHGQREKAKILRDRNLIEAGDRVGGAINFDKHAPHHIKAQAPKGIFYQGKERIPEKWDVERIDKNGNIQKVEL